MGRVGEWVGWQEAVFLLALLLVAGGCYLIYPPAAPITAGVLLLAFLFLPYLRGGKT